MSSINYPFEVYYDPEDSRLVINKINKSLEQVQHLEIHITLEESKSFLRQINAIFYNENRKQETK